MANFPTPSDKRDFHCNHCGGRILIPRELPPTTGPCPHCAGIITSPPLEAPPTETIPPATPAPPVPAPPAVAMPATAIPAAPVPAAPSASPVPSPPPQPLADPLPPRATPPPHPDVAAAPPVPTPSAKETAVPAAKPLPSDKPSTTPPKGGKPNPAAPKTPAPKRRHAAKILVPLFLVLFLVAAIGGGLYFIKQEMDKRTAPPPSAPIGMDPAAKEANYLRIGWKKEAHQVLRDYLAATTSHDKLPYILNADTLATKVEDFYGGSVIDDSDTPAEAFSVYELSEEDHKRGLFMMVYDQPPQFDLKEFFRPLASLEVQYGIDEADILLSTLARVGNFAMEPVRAHAFFKRTPEGLKLDWEIFSQTKYRTFENFAELPEIGLTGVFRVFIVEDVPDKGHLEPGTRTYRMADPANTTDTARVNVKVDSETGRSLSIINWRGTKESKPITRTATVELSWTGEPAAPELVISRFICWEFLGLGGKEAPAAPASQ